MGLTRYQKLKGAIAEIEECEKYIAALEAELAEHKWHVIDPEDEGTWPEAGTLVILKYDSQLKFYFDVCIWHEFSMLHIGGAATHYRRIVGPGGGESLPQKAHCESCEYEYIHNNRCSMCIGAHPGNDGYKSFYEKRNMELNK